MTFGERLTQLREEHGYKTRKRFAELLNIPETTLRNYETDAREPGHTFLKQMSDFFDVSTDYLLGLTEEKEKYSSHQLKSSEYEHIKKYRDLDPHGKEMVDFTLQKEWERSSANVDIKDYLLPRAARNNYESEPGELEKMKDDLANLKTREPNT